MIYFCSDHHFDHNRIMEYCSRNFNDLEHMQRELITRHNSVVNKNDVVMHLGDFSMSEKTVPAILPLLNGKFILVSGNHDRCHPCHNKSNAAKRRYMEYGFAEVHDEINNFEGMFKLNHMPYTEEGKHGEKYSQYRPKDQGSYLIHGHTHSKEKIRGRQIHIGVDAWDYFPVSIEQIYALIENSKNEI